MTNYRQRPRPVKEAIQFHFKEERDKFLSGLQHAIVMPGDAVPKQLELYDGNLLMIEHKTEIYKTQLDVLLDLEKTHPVTDPYRIVYLENCTLAKTLQHGAKHKYLAEYNVLDRDGMKCLLSRKGLEESAVKRDIALFVRGEDYTRRVVVLTFSVGPRATFVYLQHKYGKEQYQAFTKEERRGQYILDTIAKIKRLTCDRGKLNSSFLCLKAGEAAVDGSFYAFMDGCHIYKDTRVGTESFMLTCQLFFNPLKQE